MGSLVKLEVESGAGMAFWVSIEEEREGSHPGAGGGFDGKWREKASTSMSRSGCGGEGGGMEEYEARVPGVPISRWAPHKRRSKKSGWAVGGKGFVARLLHLQVQKQHQGPRLSRSITWRGRTWSRSTIAPRDAKTTDYTDLARQPSHRQNQDCVRCSCFRAVRWLLSLRWQKSAQRHEPIQPRRTDGGVGKLWCFPGGVEGPGRGGHRSPDVAPAAETRLAKAPRLVSINKRHQATDYVTTQFSPQPHSCDQAGIRNGGNHDSRYAHPRCPLSCPPGPLLHHPATPPIPAPHWSSNSSASSPTTSRGSRRDGKMAGSNTTPSTSASWSTMTVAISLGTCTGDAIGTLTKARRWNWREGGLSFRLPNASAAKIRTSPRLWTKGSGRRRNDRPR